MKSYIKIKKKRKYNKSKKKGGSATDTEMQRLRTELLRVRENIHRIRQSGLSSAPAMLTWWKKDEAALMKRIDELQQPRKLILMRKPSKQTSKRTVTPTVVTAEQVIAQNKTRNDIKNKEREIIRVTVNKNETDKVDVYTTRDKSIYKAIKNAYISTAIGSLPALTYAEKNKTIFFGGDKVHEGETFDDHGIEDGAILSLVLEPSPTGWYCPKCNHCYYYEKSSGSRQWGVTTGIRECKMCREEDYTYSKNFPPE